MQPCWRKPTREISRLSTLWASKGKPDLWFCYHPYYKAPDLIGPKLASAFAIPYVTAEASYSSRRNIGVWAETQASVDGDGKDRGAQHLLYAQGP